MHFLLNCSVFYGLCIVISSPSFDNNRIYNWRRKRAEADKMDIRGRGRDRGRRERGERGQGHTEAIIKPSSSDSWKCDCVNSIISKALEIKYERSCLVWFCQIKEDSSDGCCKTKIVLWPPLSLGRQREADNWITASLITKSEPLK